MDDQVTLQEMSDTRADSVARSNLCVSIQAKLAHINELMDEVIGELSKLRELD